MTVHHKTAHYLDDLVLPINPGDCGQAEPTVESLGDLGTVVSYLVQDEAAEEPGDRMDMGAFLAHYHRDCWIEREELPEDLLRLVYMDNRGADLDEGEQERVKALLAVYHVYPVAAHIHSGVMLYLGAWTGAASLDPGGWDTSHVGAIACSREEWPEEDKAEQYAQGMIDEYNAWSSGDVWGVVVVEYAAGDTEPREYDACWGYYGHKYAEDERYGTHAATVARIRKAAADMAALTAGPCLAL